MGVILVFWLAFYYSGQWLRIRDVFIQGLIASIVAALFYAMGGPEEKKA